MTRQGDLKSSIAENTKHLPFSIVFEECKQLGEFLTGHVMQHSGELILPFIAVTQQGKLEWRAVQQHKLNVQNRLFLLYIVGNFSVSADKNTDIICYIGM